MKTYIDREKVMAYLRHLDEALKVIEEARSDFEVIKSCMRADMLRKGLSLEMDYFEGKLRDFEGFIDSVEKE